MFRTDTGSEQRTKILEAALHVLARDGIAATTTRKIATEAGVNQAMLRYYFGSKDDLLFAVLQEMMQITRDIVHAAMSTNSHLPQAIAESIRAFWAHVETNPELQVIQYELTLYALRNPDSAWLAKQQYDGYCAIVETLFQEAYAASSRTCAISFAELARFIVGGLDGLILQFISDHDSTRAQRDLEIFVSAAIALAEGERPISHGI